MPRLRKDRAQIARERSARVKYTRQARARESKARDREPPPSLLGVGSDRCWCGNLLGHEWPGKAEGKAHPR